MTGPKRPAKKTATKQPASRRGGAKSARELSKVGPSRPGGPSKDRRSAEGRSGAKASDARQTARPTASGLGSAGHEDTRQARDSYQEGPRRPGPRPGGPRTGETQARTSRSGEGGFRSGGFKGTAPKKTGPRGAAIGVDLAAPAPETVFRDLDGAEQRFPDSNLKRVAARILAERHKPWRYRPFPFPLFTDKGQEQTFYFDFYVYDNMDMVLKLILVAPRESAEVWDKIGRFKRQYPMYSYELWTPDKLAQLQKPRTQLSF